MEEQQKPKLLQSGAACGDDDGDSMMMMMIPTLQKLGAREGLGSISSSSWKPGDHLRYSPVVLGVNKAVLWCILSCSQRGKNRATSRLRSWSRAAGSTQLEASAGKDGNKIGGVCGSWAVGSSRGDVINKCVFCGDELYPCIVSGELCVGTRLVRVFEFS